MRYYALALLLLVAEIFAPGCKSESPAKDDGPPEAEAVRKKTEEAQKAVESALRVVEEAAKNAREEAKEADD